MAQTSSILKKTRQRTDRRVRGRPLTIDERLLTRTRLLTLGSSTYPLPLVVLGLVFTLQKVWRQRSPPPFTIMLPWTEILRRRPSCCCCPAVFSRRRIKGGSPTGRPTLEPPALYQGGADCWGRVHGLHLDADQRGGDCLGGVHGLNFDVCGNIADCIRTSRRRRSGGDRVAPTTRRGRSGSFGGTPFSNGRRAIATGRRRSLEEPKPGRTEARQLI